MDKMHHPCMANGKNANVENPSMFWQQGRTHYLQLANPKKKVLKNWQNLWIFSKSFLWGLCRHVCFLWQTCEFSKKEKEKIVDDLLQIFNHPSSYTLDYFFFGKNVLFFSLVAIENL
jgi:hypothetical protein